MRSSIKLRLTLNIFTAAALLCADTGYTAKKPVMRTEGFTSVAFSPNSDRLAHGDSEIVWVAEIERNVRIAKLDATGLPSAYVKTHSDRHGVGDTLIFVGNDLVATTGMGGLVSLWDINSSSRIAVIDPPDKKTFATSLDWSEKIKRLAIGTQDGQILQVGIDDSTPGQLEKLGKLDHYVFDLEYGPEGKLIASTGHMSPVIIWNTTSLEEQGRLSGLNLAVDLDVTTASNRLLIVGERLWVWNFLTYEQAARIGDSSLVGQNIGAGMLVAIPLTVLAYGSVLGGTAPPPGAVDGATHALPILSFLGGRSVQVKSLCGRAAGISPDGKTAVTSVLGRLSAVVSVIDIEGDVVIKKLKTHRKPCDIEYSSDGKHVLIGTTDGVYRYDTTDWSESDLMGRYALKRGVPRN